MTFSKLAYAGRVLRELAGDEGTEKTAFLGLALGALNVGLAAKGGVDQTKKFYQGFKPQAPQPAAMENQNQ